MSQFDYIIIGAGPAGFQVGYQMQLAGLNYLIVDKGSSVCEFFKTEPRHRTLISINKVYPGVNIPEDEKMRYDWNSLLLDDFKKFGYYTEEYFPPADNVVKYM